MARATTSNVFNIGKATMVDILKVKDNIINLIMKKLAMVQNSEDKCKNNVSLLLTINVANSYMPLFQVLEWSYSTAWTWIG